MFGAGTYRAFKIQKEYLLNKIANPVVKPNNVGVERASCGVDHLTNWLYFSPSPPNWKQRTHGQSCTEVEVENQQLDPLLQKEGNEVQSSPQFFSRAL